MRSFVRFLVLALAGGVALVLIGRRSRSRGATMPDPRVCPDPRDPVQCLDDVHQFHVEELGVDAVDDTDALADQDLERLDADTPVDEIDTSEARYTARDDDISPSESASPVEPQARPAEIARARRGSGELYGVHVPHASDTDLPDDDHSFAEGENWMEALEEHAIEGGPQPEEELDIVDDEDVEPPPTDTRDRPVADRGSAGPRGL